MTCNHAASGCDYPAGECTGACMSAPKQAEALMLADGLELHASQVRASRGKMRYVLVTPDECDQAAAELRRLHAANIDCVDWFEAIKADNERLHALNADLLHALTRIRALPVHADAIRMAHKHAEDAIAKAANNAK